MKRFCVILGVLMLIGCSTFSGIKAEDIDNAEARLQQIALTLGSMKDLDEAIDLLAKAKLAMDANDKVKAKEYRDALLIVMDILEEK